MSWAGYGLQRGAKQMSSPMESHLNISFPQQQQNKQQSGYIPAPYLPL